MIEQKTSTSNCVEAIYMGHSVRTDDGRCAACGGLMRTGHIVHRVAIVGGSVYEICDEHTNMTNATRKAYINCRNRDCGPVQMIELDD